VARPQDPVFDIGLTPGRRYMKLHRQVALDKGDVTPSAAPPSYSLGPSLPQPRSVCCCLALPFSGCLYDKAGNLLDASQVMSLFR
jgi:hypothetical protein